MAWTILPDKLEEKVSEYLKKPETDSRISQFDFRLGIRWMLDNYFDEAPDEKDS